MRSEIENSSTSPEVLQANYDNFKEQYVTATQLLDTLKNQKVPSPEPHRAVLYLRSKDRKSIHLYEVVRQNSQESITRIPYWHAVGSQFDQDCSDIFFKCIDPEGVLSLYNEKIFGFQSQFGAENTAIHGSGDPHFSLFGMYAMPSKNQETLGDSFVLQLYSNDFKIRQEDEAGKITTTSFSTELKASQPRLLGEGRLWYAAVERTMPEDIRGVIVINDIQNLTKERMMFYYQKMLSAHAPISSYSFCIPNMERTPPYEIIKAIEVFERFSIV